MKKPRSGCPGALVGAVGAGFEATSPLTPLMKSTHALYAGVPLKMRSLPSCLMPPSRLASGFKRNFDCSGFPGTINVNAVA